MNLKTLALSVAFCQSIQILPSLSTMIVGRRSSPCTS